MSSLLLSFLVFIPAQDMSYRGTPRKPSPLAPSLPLLTEKEYAEIDAIIDRFIEYDIGKLKGPAGRKALDDFKALGPEAIPPLIEGFNKAARLEHSCPAVIIGDKLSRLLMRSRDAELLEYARENIGGDVKSVRHRGTIQKLRLECMLRKTAVLRQPGTPTPSPGQRAFNSLPLKDLVAAADKETGPRLKGVLVEIEKRQGPQVLDILARQSTSSEKEIQELAGALLKQHLYRQSPALLKARLGDENAEIRAAAANVIGVRELPLALPLIDLLNDADTRVSQAARQALIRLAGQDLGSEPSRWREWASRRQSPKR